MRYAAALASTLALSALSCGAEPAVWGSGFDTSEPPLRIATYNIHHWVGTDGNVDVDRIADVIEGLDVDVVAVQEADNRALNDGSGLGRQEALAERLGWRWVEFDSGHDTPWVGVHGNAVLLSPEAELVSSTYHDVTQPDREPRAYTDTVVEVRGQRVRLLGAHLGLNRRERQEQVRHIASRLDDQTDVDGTVIAGDFNEWNPLARTFSALRDLVHEVKTEQTFPAGTPVLRLDRIWTSKHSQFQRVEVVRTADSAVASDHLPVRAELVF